MKVFRPSIVLGTAAFAAVLVSSACSSTPSGPSVATLSNQYQAIVTATNAELAKDKNAKSPAQTDAKYGAAFHHAAVEVHALMFPASMQPDAKALVAALDKMSTEAAAVSAAAAKNQNVAANVTAMANLNLKLIEEEKVEKDASNALRSDLGLPPETTTTTTPPPSTTVPLSSTTTKPPTTSNSAG
jgi:hypothetical protein